MKIGPFFRAESGMRRRWRSKKSSGLEHGGADDRVIDYRIKGKSEVYKRNEKNGGNKVIINWSTKKVDNSSEN